MPSSRAVLPVLGWCAATLASIALASVALLPVLRTGTSRGSDLAAGVSIAEPPADAVTAPAPPGSGPSASSAPVPSAPTRSAPPTVIDGWTVTTDGDGKRVYVRAFRVDGGTAVIRMTEGRVYLLTATPNPGYRVETTQNEPGNLAVQFIQQNHFFVIHAVWHNDGPFAEVSEVGN